MIFVFVSWVGGGNPPWLCPKCLRPPTGHDVVSESNFFAKYVFLMYKLEVWGENCSKKLSEITQFSRFFPSSNSVFDLRSSSSTTVYSISLSSTLIFVCFHLAQPLTIQLTDDVPNSLDWLKFLLDEDTKTKPVHAPSPSFVSRILNYSLVCSFHISRLWKRLFWFMEGIFRCCDW